MVTRQVSYVWQGAMLTAVPRTGSGIGIRELYWLRSRIGINGSSSRPISPHLAHGQA